ncbi:hypothetical protein [uncultured Methanobrevibacter sp.]|uniref:hypothetical protein n=1 Tax=uncultured Methanobrevibacter sp. TaxID=253161 RepID=UPI0026009BA8|nr:hypothetical protein [uncultured Methanobrevibacter sp.]
MPDNFSEEINRKCFRQEPFLTPNNYDIYFNPSEIPSNIPQESGYNLERRLQKLMPVTKIIHLNVDSATVPADNHVRVFTEMSVNNKKVVFI